MHSLAVETTVGLYVLFFYKYLYKRHGQNALGAVASVAETMDC